MRKRCELPKKDIKSIIDFRDLFDKDGVIRLNPFVIGSRTLRVTGTYRCSDNSFNHTLKCEETGEFKDVKHYTLMAKSRESKPKPLIKLKYPYVEAFKETIEEHREKFPSQVDMFHFVDDVKTKEKGKDECT